MDTCTMESLIMLAVCSFFHLPLACHGKLIAIWVGASIWSQKCGAQRRLQRLSLITEQPRWQCSCIRAVARLACHSSFNELAASFNTDLHQWPHGRGHGLGLFAKFRLQALVNHARLACHSSLVCQRISRITASDSSQNRTAWLAM